MTLDGAIFFNCCTGFAEPDWSAFDWLEVGGCITLDDGSVEGGQDDGEAEFWTVYGHLKDGGCEAITDVHDSREKANAVALVLYQLSGLPVIL